MDLSSDLMFDDEHDERDHVEMEYDEDNPREEVTSDVGEDDGEINDGEEINEAADGATEAKPAKPKRVIKNPQPKLNCQRLKTGRGLSALLEQFKDFQFNKHGHEKHDLGRILRRLEHWAHRLYPRLQFPDFIEQMERLGRKQECKGLLKRIRLDMHEPDEEIKLVGGEEGPEINDPDNPPANTFDDLLDEQDRSSPPPPAFAPSPRPTFAPPPPPPRSQEELSDEQKERMERNRLMALEKRRVRLLEQQQNNTIGSTD